MDIIDRVGEQGGLLTSQGLKEATRLLDQQLQASQTEYEQLKRDQRDSLAGYNKESSRVWCKWRQCRGELTGFLEECRLVADVDCCGDILGDQRYEDYQWERMFEAAIEAVEDSVEVCKYKYSDSDYTIHGINLQTLVGFLMRNPEMTQAARLYCILYSNKHMERLEALPQQAAVFLSECSLLSRITGADDIKLFAASFYQLHVVALKGQFEGVGKSGGAVSINADSIGHLLKRPFSQCLLLLSRFRAVTETVLRGGDEWMENVGSRAVVLLSRTVADALFAVLTNVSGGIGKDCVGELKQTLANVIEATGGLEYETVEKLRAIRDLCDQTLLLWIGAFRKHSYKLSQQDYTTLIRTFFADSSLRSALLKEIAECRDESEEDY